MNVTVIAVALVLGLAPLVAGLADLVTSPTALSELFSPRILSLWGGTVLLGLATAVCSALVGAPVGWMVARCRRTGLVGALLPLPLILPPWVVGVAWTEAAPLSGFWGAVFLLTASLWPLVALFALRGFRATARAGEAAVVFRGRRAAWRKVELPLALPSILSGALLVFVFATTDFGVVDFLSFSSPEPFVVLSSEIFQKWARVQSGEGAAAVSVPAILSSLVALGGMLALERRHLGRFRGAAPRVPRLARLGAPRVAGLLALAAITAVPLVVLVGWSLKGDDPLAPIGAHRDKIMLSVMVAAATGLLVAGFGVKLARLTLAWGPRRGDRLFALLLLPLAAPAVTFAVGEIRLWNHPWNPLADAVYPSPVLLVLALTGRMLPLGVLAARAVLVRQDPLPYAAARLTGRPFLTRWLRIELPMLAPATGLAFSLGFLLSLRELDIIVLVPAGSRTLAHVIFSMVHIGSDAVTAVLCLTLVALVLVPAMVGRLLGVPGVDCGPSGRVP
jgi:iron(III) transport system permease protein